jgi:hypothetical protein
MIASTFFIAVLVVEKALAVRAEFLSATAVPARCFGEVSRPLNAGVAQEDREDRHDWRPLSSGASALDRGRHDPLSSNIVNWLRGEQKFEAT